MSQQRLSELFRKVIRIRAEDSPNVIERRYVLPGVLSWEEYQQRRATWDKIRQCIGLDAQFYEGAETLLYPSEWLNRAELIAEQLKGRRRYAKAIGVDPAEGGDKTAMCAVDEYGIIELVSKKTPDTSVVTAECLAFMRKYAVHSGFVAFDRGGGGKQHADRLRDQGYPVRTIAFGESPSLDPRRNIRNSERLEMKEERYAYRNRRAEMYGTLRLLLDPATGKGFGIPAEYSELRRQLAPIPLVYDPEGRLELPPKNRRGPNDTKKTLVELIGCSPDDADALVLSVFAMLNPVVKLRAGALK